MLPAALARRAVRTGLRCSRTCSSRAAIRTIDLDAPGAAAALDASFSISGFAVIVGKAVPGRGTLHALHAAALKFFHAPLEEKQAYHLGQGYGKGGYLNGEERGSQLLGDFEKPIDWVESLTLPNILSGNDFWNASASLKVPPVLEEPLKPFYRECRAVKLGVESLVEQALHLPTGFLYDNAIEPAGGGIRLAYYPKQDQPPLPGQLRYGEHVDSGGLTLIRLDPTASFGTQVKLPSGEWIDVPYVEDSFVVNVGALMSRWTNGRWLASVHRVQNHPAERFSIVTSCCNFRSKSIVEPLPTCVSTDKPSKYQPVEAGKFLQERAALHRPTYAEERGLSSQEAMAKLQQQIQDYQM